MVNYNNLWEKLIYKYMKKTDLVKMARISSATMAKMSMNQAVSMNILVKICAVLECDLSDIVTITLAEERI